MDEVPTDASEDAPTPYDSEMEANMEARLVAKGSEAKRLSLVVRTIGKVMTLRKTPAQSAEFVKELRVITEWGAVLQTRGREVVQMQCGQVGGICKVLGSLHSEHNAVAKIFTESFQELADASKAASEHLEALERALLDERENGREHAQALATFREEMRKELLSLREEVKVSKNSVIESIKKSEQASREELQQSLLDEISVLRIEAQKNNSDTDRMSRQVEELDEKVVGSLNRLRDEQHRVDNLADHALRAVGALDKVQRQLTWVEGAEQDVKNVARTVGSLTQELRSLKGLGSDDEVFRETEDELGQQEGEPRQGEVAQKQQVPSGRASAVSSVSGADVPAAVVAPAGVTQHKRASNQRLLVQRTSSRLPTHESLVDFPASPSANAYQSRKHQSMESEDYVSSSALGALGRLEQRVAQVEAGEKELLQAHENLERRVSANQFNKGSLESLKKECAQLGETSAVFQESVHESLIKFKKTEMEHAIQNFRARWTTVVTLICPLEIFKCWVEFVHQRNRCRQALVKVKTVYAQRHVGSRVQSWNYISQKCLQQALVTRIQHRTESAESQLETLAATVRKRERAAVEQAKDVHSRISTVEKKIENHSAKKADHSAMVGMVGALEARIERELDPEKIKQNTADLWDAVKSLETTKTDTKMTERNGKRVNDLTVEVRQAVKSHSTALLKCATAEDLAGKANASIVEQVVVMLAQQADQLARLVASDLDMFKLTLGRFLELSPDVRKAALSLGLQENEQCVTCRKISRKLVVEPLSGTDGNLYRISPDTLDAIGEETQRVVNEKIKFPAQLMSSLVAGNAGSPFGNSWVPVRPQSGAEPSNQPSKASAKIFNPDEVEKAELQGLLSRIRTLVTKESGWLAGPDLRTLAGADVSARRKAKAARKSPSPERASRPQSVAGQRDPAGRPWDGQRPTAPGQGRPVSSRSYFPASATNEQGPRSLFKDLPQAKKTAPEVHTEAAPPLPELTQVAAEVPCLPMEE